MGFSLKSKKEFIYALGTNNLVSKLMNLSEKYKTGKKIHLNRYFFIVVYS